MAGRLGQCGQGRAERAPPECITCSSIICRHLRRGSERTCFTREPGVAGGRHHGGLPGYLNPRDG